MPKISSLYDVETEVQTQMDNVIRDNGTPESEVVYPSIDYRIGLSGSPSGLGIAVPVSIHGKKAGLGFTWTTPLMLDIEMLGTGINLGIESEQEIQNNIERIRMRIRMGLTGVLSLITNQLQFGGGIEVQKNTTIGMTVSRLMLDAKANMFARIGGIIEKSGTEYAFNDLNDPRIDFNGVNPETNELNQTFNSHLSGSAWGFKIGAIHDLSPSMQLGLTLNLAPQIKTRADKFSIVHTIPFIKMDDDSAENISDRIDATEINLAKLTLTEKTVKDDVYDVELHLPNSLNLGFLYQSGNFTLALRLSQHFGELSYVIVDHESRGFKFKQGFGLGLDLKYFFLGTSVSLLDEILPEDSDSEPMKNLPLPKLNLGFRIPIYEGLWGDVLVGVEPIPLIRLSARYSF